jgi:hypothetical protein
MKTAVVGTLLVLSLSANTLLAWRLLSTSDDARKGMSTLQTSAELRPSSPATAAKGPDGTAPGGNWNTLRDDGNLPGLVTRLRAAGYPARVVRAIVGAAVSEHFAARIKALAPSLDESGFWSTRSPFIGFTDPARMAARRELAREQSALMKELVGADAEADHQIEMSASLKRQFGDIPREKVEQLQQITRDYQDMTTQIRTESQGMMLREDREKLAFLEAEKRKDIAKLLSPAEFEEYLLRNSQSAMQLRSRLNAFEPTEQEFRSLFKLQEAFDQQFGSTAMGPRTPESMQLRRAAEEKLVADAKALLGPERGAEFERGRDYSYTTLVNIAKRLELPKESAATVWQLEKDFQQRSTELQRNPNLTAEQRTQEMDTLRASANGKVMAVLGPRGHAAYQEHSGGWLRPPPTPTRSQTTPAPR